MSRKRSDYDLIHPHPALPTSCNERAPVPCDCGPVAMILGRVATIMGRTILASCNQCGPGGAMIAVPSADVCGPLQVALLLGCCPVLDEPGFRVPGGFWYDKRSLL